jgi:hypothetical protein
VDDVEEDVVWVSRGREGLFLEAVDVAAILPAA